MGKSIEEETNVGVKVRNLKAKIAECKERLLRSELWSSVVEELETEILENWVKQQKCSSSRCKSRPKCMCYSIVLFVIGLGSLESTFSSSFSSFFQLAAVTAINEHINLEGIYFCDPEFTQADRELIFELFTAFSTHVEVFTGHDISIPLNTVQYQLKNKFYGRDSQINLFFFMPHCDRCVFGMLIHYFKVGEGKQLYSDSARIIVWGNNLETFMIDSSRNFNRECEYCKTLSLVLSNMDFSKTRFPVEDYTTVFCSSFSDLSIYLLPID